MILHENDKFLNHAKVPENGICFLDKSECYTRI